MIGLFDFYVFPIDRQVHVIVVIRKRIPNGLAHFGKLVRLQLQIGILVEVHDDGGGEDLVEAPDVAQLLNAAVRGCDNLEPCFHENMRMGEGGGGGQ